MPGMGNGMQEVGTDSFYSYTVSWMACKTVLISKHARSWNVDQCCEKFLKSPSSCLDVVSIEPLLFSHKNKVENDNENETDLKFNLLLAFDILCANAMKVNIIRLYSAHFFWFQAQKSLNAADREHKRSLAEFDQVWVVHLIMHIIIINSSSLPLNLLSDDFQTPERLYQTRNRPIKYRRAVTSQLG